MQQLKKQLNMLCLYRLGQNCLHLTFKPYLSSETYSRKYEKLPNIVIHACKNMTEKMNLLKMSKRLKSLFIPQTMHYNYFNHLNALVE